MKMGGGISSSSSSVSTTRKLLLREYSALRSQHLLTVDFLLIGSVVLPHMDDLVKAQGRLSYHVLSSQ